MKMSTRGRYGLRVMMELAKSYGEGPVLVDEIARAQGISGKYLHVLMGGLRSSGLILAARGRSGGYALAKKPSAITLLDVVSAMEGRTAPVDCVADRKVCPRSRRCAARDVWCDVATAIDGVLSSLTLEQFAARQKAKRRGA